MIPRIFFILFAGAGLLSNEALQQKSVKAHLPLSITLTSAALSPKGVLRCAWKMRNNGGETIHVYSSYLERSSVDMVQPRNGQMLLILTTWLNEQRNTYPAYEFPKPTFIAIEPGKEVAGTLERSVSIQQIGSRQKIALVIGYVTDFVQFRKDMENSLQRGVEFQGNPIVRWQKIQYSTPVQLMRH